MKIKIALASLMIATNLSAEISPAEIMNKAYGTYNTRMKCWVSGDYCMKIDSVKRLDCDTGKRVYLLATGKNMLDDSHASSGAIGAFVVENQNGKDVFVAQNKILKKGSWGTPPIGWRLIKLAPTDYWGWINRDNWSGQGYSVESYSILAPYGKKIKEIASINKSANNEGVGGNIPLVDMHSTFSIDSRDNQQKIYPLIVTVSGTNNSKKIKLKRYIIPFDFKKWEYDVPDDMMPSF